MVRSLPTRRNRQLPHSPRSLQITRRYQQRVFAVRARVELQARRAWPTIQDLDGTRWPEQMSAVVSQAETEAIRAAAGYAQAFLTSELGRRVRGPAVDSRRYAGLSRDGRPLAEAFRSPLVTTLAALKQGVPAAEALALGLNKGARTVGVDFDHAHRSALLDAIDGDDRFSGWKRATTGTCGACLDASSDEIHFEVHPGCQCVSEPTVRGVRDLAPRLTGMALFESMTPEHQDEALGPDVAELVRTGEVPLSRLKKRTPLETQEDFISQAPVEALK